MFVLTVLMGRVPMAAAAPGSVRGVVHDPQHLPVPGATVTLTADRADWHRTAITDSNGEFLISEVPLGDYTLAVTLSGFAPATLPVTVVSGASPVLHVPLALASVSHAVSVSAEDTVAAARSSTPTTLVNRRDVERTPGADRANGLQVITDFTPGATVVHDQLHVQGGHQVSWLIDGVPVPNTNIATNVGPQVDPKDMDYVEVARGGYGADAGDRTFGVFNVVPRTGFERDREIEVVATAGSARQTNDQVSIGSHTQRFAYYASGAGNRSDIGLDPPVAEVVHDRETGVSGFGSLIFNAAEGQQFRLVASSRRDTYQIPTSPEDRAAGIRDEERESDTFVNGSWVRAFSAHALLTISPFYHRNTADYLGGPEDEPATPTVRRASSYGGAQATVNVLAKHHDVLAGVYGFHEWDAQRIDLTPRAADAPGVSSRQTPTGGVAAAFVQDRVAVTSWLTVSAGLRATRFSGGLVEHAVSPRAGAWLQVPGLGWIVRGSYGRFYQEPPLVTASGPLLDFVTSQDLAFIPLRGERDAETQVGLTVPVRGWSVDVGAFHLRATNFFDHNSIGNSNIFFPLTIDGARIRGADLSVRSPRAWHALQVHLAYAYQVVQGRGGISGGLTDFEPPEEGYFPLDHDQRQTLSAGLSADLPHGLFASGNLSYGSGFLDGEGPAHLPGRTIVDLAGGAAIGRNLSVSVNVLNVANERVLVDNSLTFGGTHWTAPRQVYVALRYRFRY